jgi:hypothetical protein
VSAFKMNYQIQLFLFAIIFLSLSSISLSKSSRTNNGKYGKIKILKKIQLMLIASNSKELKPVYVLRAGYVDTVKLLNSVNEKTNLCVLKIIVQV